MADYKKRVVHVCWSLGNGGAEKQIMYIIKNQAEIGIDVNLILVNDVNYYVNTLSENGISPTICVGRNVFSKVMYLFLALHRSRAHSVISWMYTCNLLCGFYALFNWRINLFWNVRSSDVVKEGNSWLTNFAIYGSILLSVRVSAVIYNSLRGKLTHKAIYRFTKNVVVRNAIEIMSNEHIHRNVNLKPVIVSIGRFNEYKDYPNMIKVIERLNVCCGRSLSFVLAGHGIDYNNRRLIEMFSESTIPSNVEIIGPVSDVETLLRRVDVLIIHSKSEGVSNILLEAVQQGCFVISTDVGDSHLVLSDHRFLTPIGDYKSLASAVISCLNLTETEAEGIRKDNHDNLHKYFDYEKQLVKYNQIIGVIDGEY